MSDSLFIRFPSLTRRVPGLDYYVSPCRRYSKAVFGSSQIGGEIIGTDHVRC